ncbi:glycosyltransferase family 2 protein [Fulvivirgaceae bacterium BMA10]|uniref:Glycosyltransferase family 2 protein n=1 Tax=Splendidivirga corallicola TaxID=3051826 RepID=A0ABT8KJN9_9BACT|nr:glycosyltransferase family 2 protein [Fulvivirgaceae bacterium BMA10]
MIKLSVIIITLNEERNIGRCLESIQEVADEVLVVDSYSTDKTEEICRQYSVRFLQHQFDGYSQQKNWANQQAKYPHVLSLDADEVLSEELKTSILEIKNNWQYDAYYLNRVTQFCGRWIRHGGWSPDKKLRLWDNRLGKWEGDKVHETFVLQKDAKTTLLKGDLLHYSINSIDQQIGQINKFSSLKAQQDFEKGKRPSWIKICFGPPIKFLKSYIVLLGFLDGFQGFLISANSAHAKFLHYVKLRQLYKDNE